MHSIDPEFNRLFDELEESGHIDLRQRLNAMPEKGPELLDRLSDELKIFEPWQFKITDALGQIAFERAPELRKDHQPYIRNTPVRIHFISTPSIMISRLSVTLPGSALINVYPMSWGMPFI